MGRSLEQRSSKQLQVSDAFKAETLAPLADKSLQFQDKHKIQHPFGKPYIDQHSELRRGTNIEHEIQFKSSENKEKSRSGSKTFKDDELVKHMSNLPGFLQQAEKQRSFQDKALNFGVLDWKRLEKWKYNERMPTKGQMKKPPLSSSSGFMASEPHGLNPSPHFKGEQPSSRSSHFNPLLQSKRPPPHIKHSNLSQGGEKIKDVKSYRGKAACIEDSQGTRISSIIDGMQDNFYEKNELNGGRSCMVNGEKKDSEKDTLSEKGTSHDTITSQGKKGETRVEDEIDLACQYHPVDAQNNMLLVPERVPEGSYLESSQSIISRASFDGQLTGSRTSFDGQFAKANGNRFPDSFSPGGVYSGELSAGIAHSCPLPTGVTDHDKPGTFEAKRSTLKEEGRDFSEHSAVKGRHPSPSGRFSFSLGRLSRSFSFKESSEVPQLSSTYTAAESCPVRRELSSSSKDKCDRDKSNSSGRGRSSPLRRLLDPLLKYKGSHSSGTVRPPDGSSHSTIHAKVNGPVSDRKAEASTVQAFLQLTLKKGLPFFKLVVENSSDMLSAVIESLPSSRKSDYSTIYSIYSVKEIGKKSVNWKNQGSKSKSCGLGYNMIGQMKISSSRLHEINVKDSVQYVVRECVLYSVDQGQVDNQTHEYLLNREIAAIVIKNRNEKLDDVNLIDNSRSCMKSELTNCVSGVTYDSEEDGNSNSTVVILPSGCHAIPIKGAPSSLINRWESGGSCDCGGWDVGCKLRILKNHKKNSNILEASMSSTASDHVKLYLQGRVRESKPIFSLEALENGLYSVKFDSSISLLETFSTCVAVITCQKFSEILDMNVQPEAIVSTQVQGQAPAKYVTCPPPSPVGRI